jgi:polyhydroxybutyrate depolymerase
MAKKVLPRRAGGWAGARALAAALPAAVLAAACASLSVPVELSALVHNDTNRSYRLYVPASVRAKGEPAPLLLVLHGAGPGFDIMDITRIAPVADREGFAVAFPNAVGDLWNDGALRVLGANQSSDVAFLRRVVAEIDAKELRIDKRRVFAIGISNGGMMSLRLACEAADLFAGVGAVAANMPKALADDCRPSAPVPVIVINGTEDPIIPYRGGGVRLMRVMRFGEVLSTDETMTLWARLNGCGPPAPAEALPDRDPGDASRAVRVDYGDCRGARMRLIRVEGGGHAWPGGMQFLPALMIGPVNRDIDAGEAAWTFFKEIPSR